MRSCAGNGTSKASLVHQLIWAGDDGADSAAARGGSGGATKRPAAPMEAATEKAAKEPAKKKAAKKSTKAQAAASKMAAAEVRWSGSASCKSVGKADELAMHVASQLGMQAMSRMCRKGMGYNFFGAEVPDGLRDAEHTVDSAAEVKKLERAFGPVASLPAARRPADLLAFNTALANAWHQYSEAQNEKKPHACRVAHACLAESWFDEFLLDDLAQQYVALWVETAAALKDHVPPQPVLEALAAIPPLVDGLCGQKPVLGMFRLNPHLFSEKGKQPTTPAALETTGAFGQAVVGTAAAALQRKADAAKCAKENKAAAENAAETAMRSRQSKAKKNGHLPGVDVCYDCCEPLDDDDCYNRTLNGEMGDGYTWRFEADVPSDSDYDDDRVKDDLLYYCEACYEDRRADYVADNNLSDAWQSDEEAEELRHYRMENNPEGYAIGQYADEYGSGYAGSMMM